MSDDVNIIGCMRVSDAAKPAAPSSLMQCEECKAPVWRSFSSFDVVAKTFCIQCLRQRAATSDEEFTVKHSPGVIAESVEAGLPLEALEPIVRHLLGKKRRR